MTGIERGTIIEIVDANTGALVHTVPIAGVRDYPRCDFDSSGDYAACEVDDELAFIEVATSRITTRLELRELGPVVPADDGFVVYFDRSEQMVSFDASGRERWRATSKRENFAKGGAVIPVHADESDLFAEGHVEFRRVSDGRVVLGLDTGSTPQWSQYIGGFVVAGADGAAFYDLDGNQTATGEVGWTPISNFSSVDGGGDVPSLPVLSRTAEADDDDAYLKYRVTAASFNPATGHPLQSATIYHDEGPSELGSVSGVGTVAQVVMTFAEGGRHAMFDVYSGGFSRASGNSSKSRAVAYDGTRVLISDTGGLPDRTELTAYEPEYDGNAFPNPGLWSLTVNGPEPVSYDGKVYVGLTRII